MAEMFMRHLTNATVLWPVLLTQGLYVAARASRLPEAEGPRTGTLGSGPDLRMLVLGDSSAAGVGVRRQEDALGGQLAQALSDRFTVHWEVNAVSGATTASTLARLDAVPAGACDVAVIALGVNDAKNGVSLSRWRRNYSALLQRLKAGGATRIFVSGLPPLGLFPLLPQPLRGVLGKRAARFDAVLAQLAAAQGAVHLAFDLPFDAGLMAEDGFHPGPRVYTAWAEAISRRI